MYQPIALPPGIRRQNSELQAAGGWWDCDKIRWYGDQVGPIGGWRVRSTSAVTGIARAILPWQISDASRFIMIGTHTNLYVQVASGVNHDITPSAFIAGNADETTGGGYGSGLYGSGTYGTPPRDLGTTVPALVWDLDTFADLGVACAFSDGRLFSWDDVPADVATVITNAPTDCLGVMVTEQGFIFGLGAGGDSRKIQWSDQGAMTVWSPSSTNQAGDIDLVTSGSIVKGVRLGPLALILTTLDAHVGRYVGLPLVYTFERKGDGCGAISKGCLVKFGAQAAWWAKSGFWVWDGSVRKLDCKVWDFVQSNLNTAQQSKVSGFHNSVFGEVWWLYPSVSGSEIDSYVAWNYVRDIWFFGTLERTCAAEASAFKWPIALSPAGDTYEHEVGSAYDDDTVIFAETGPLMIGSGERVMDVKEVISDATPGDVTVSFKTRPYPRADEETVAAVTLDANGRGFPRFSARQTRMRTVFAANPDARLGNMNLLGQPGGLR